MEQTVKENAQVNWGKRSWKKYEFTQQIQKEVSGSKVSRAVKLFR